MPDLTRWNEEVASYDAQSSGDFLDEQRETVNMACACLGPDSGTLGMCGCKLRHHAAKAAIRIHLVRQIAGRSVHLGSAP